MADEQKEVQQPETEQPKYTQKDLDGLNAKTRHYYENQVSEYKQQLDELSKFKTEHEKSLEAQQQKDLEAQKEYEKLKEGWSTRESEYKKMIDAKESELKNMRIDNALTSEVMKQGLYLEAKDLIKSNAVIDTDGTIKIKGRDDVGETMLSVEEGIKKFAESKPYLVKAQNKGGAGTASVETAGGNTQSGDDLALARELEQAMKVGNRQEVLRIKAQIRANHSQRGIVGMY